MPGKFSKIPVSMSMDLKQAVCTGRKLFTHWWGHFTDPKWQFTRIYLCRKVTFHKLLRLN